MPGARGGDPKIVVAYDASSSLKHGVTNILYFATLSIAFTTDSNETGRSAKGVLRGLHYQIQQPQGKLVRVTQGEVFDVAVDIRKSSPTFGKWVGEILSAQNNKQIWVPPGFAHGFLVLSETVEFLHKTTDFWLRSSSAALPETTLPLASSGRCTASCPHCPTKTRKANRWRRRTSAFLVLIQQ